MKTVSHKNKKGIAGIITALLLSISLWLFFSASWVHIKAILAQQLLNHSWSQTLHNANNTYKPWPWADTWPVAQLLVPQYDIKQIVLAGDNGNSLAFGPGHSFSSAAPNTNGTTVISAHRDTHFSFLKNIKLQDTLYIQTAEKTLPYQVYEVQIVDSSNFTLANHHDEATLVLVTCYPFDAITAGGPLRYLVFASLKTNEKII